MKTDLSAASLYRKIISVSLFFLLFSFSIMAQPSRDNCSGATSLTSATSCSNTQANLSGATASTGIPAGCASAGTHYDIWYSFTAQSSSHTVTISNRQANFTNPELQIFSGTCGSFNIISMRSHYSNGNGANNWKYLLYTYL
jgi:hypothetical protein